MNSTTPLKVFLALLVIYCVRAFKDDQFRAQEQTYSNGVNVRELEFVSKVVLRYAHVTVRSYVENLGSSANDVTFQVRIPKEAFVTGFMLVTNNKTNQAVIKEKGEALREYNKARKSIINAGHVTLQEISDEFDRDLFKVEVNVASNTVVEFRLEYEELLQRHAGKYSQKIYVYSEHVIPKLEVRCELKDKQKFKMLTYKTPFYTERVHAVYTSRATSTDGYYFNKIDWKPSIREQENAKIGMDVPFEIEYELDAFIRGGMVFMNHRGEFAHMFSAPCEERKIMNKQIVFVIDISGSMDGNPIEQVKEAMASILSRLRPHDYFNIILFSGSSIMWKGNFQQATVSNVNAAKIFVKGMVKADGATNINDALLLAVDMFDQDVAMATAKNSGQVIMFLTDGSPTYGETDTKAIRRNARGRNYFNGETCCKASINTIAFGKFADKDFLQVIAQEHEGILTIIKETESNVADSELIKIYKGIENPYYKNLMFSFTANDRAIPETNLTQTQYLQYDCGNEIIICGWTYPEAEVRPTVKANGVENEIIFKSVPTVFVPITDSEKLSRLVAYKRVKLLLKEAETTLYPERKETANKMALELSLDYGFVTPLTSLVVPDYSKRSSSHGHMPGNGNTTRQTALIYVLALYLVYVLLLNSDW